MIIEQSLYATKDSQDEQIKIEISNYSQKKSGLSSYTIYTIKGKDSIGSFEYEKRYSDFDYLREFLVNRWPGCFIPPLPIKKVIGKNDLSFVEQRKRGLEFFLIEVSKLRHLWNSKEFQVFLRSDGDIEKNFKQIAQENHEDIIKKYDQIFPKLNGKSQDTIILGRVLDFGNYIKKIQPVITGFKEMALNFIQSKNANAEQLSILLNYILPQYEKSCLSIYCNQITEGKFIFNEVKDQKLAGLIKEFKELLGEINFEELYFNLEREEREIESFNETYKGKAKYEDKLKSLKSQEKDLELQMAKLNSGKQGFFASFSGNVESNKTKTTKQIQNTRQDIKIYTFLNDLLILLLGYFQIERFRKQKLKLYFDTMRKIALFQIKFANVRSKICEHVLQNHNLLEI